MNIENIIHEKKVRHCFYFWTYLENVTYKIKILAMNPLCFVTTRQQILSSAGIVHSEEKNKSMQSF